MGDALLTVKEVAARLNCHPHTVRRWIWSRKLSAVKVGDMVRIPEEEVRKFLVPDKATGTEKLPLKGARALLSAMRRLKETVDPEDVEALEQRLRETEQATDWNDPFA